MADQLDVEAMIARFRARADAVKQRNLPPVEGPQRMQFIKQAEEDFLDFAIISDAKPSLVDGILTLTVDLRPPEAEVGIGKRS